MNIGKNNELIFSKQDENIKILFEEIFPKGYKVINFNKIEGGRTLNLDRVLSYTKNPQVEIKIRGKWSKKAYLFRFKLDNYGFNGFIWYLWLDLKQCKFTNILKYWDKEKLREAIREYIKERKFDQLCETLS